MAPIVYRCTVRSLSTARVQIPGRVSERNEQADPFGSPPCAALGRSLRTHTGVQYACVLVDIGVGRFVVILDKERLQAFRLQVQATMWGQLRCATHGRLQVLVLVLWCQGAAPIASTSLPRISADPLFARLDRLKQLEPAGCPSGKETDLHCICSESEDCVGAHCVRGTRSGDKPVVGFRRDLCPDCSCQAQAPTIARQVLLTNDRAPPDRDRSALPCHHHRRRRRQR